MLRGLWVAELLISDRTAQKLAGRHGLEADEVRRAVACVPDLVYTWDDDPDRGLRAIVRITVGARTVLVVLYPHPLGDDIFHLGSAYPID